MSSIQTFCRAIAGTAIVLALNAWAEPSPDEVLVETSEAKLTRADYDAAMARIPSDLRDEFATSSRRVTAFLNNILITKTLAARARQHGLDPEPGLALDTPADVDRALATAETSAGDEAAGKEFDAKRSSLVVTARETYLLDKDQFQRAAQVKLSAILISTEPRGDEAALALARSTRDKLLAWADFAALAKEVSEDKESAAQGGQLPWASGIQMNPTLERAAFDELKVNEISEPLKIGKAYLLIRVDERKAAGTIPFEEVKDSILDKMRADYVNSAREARLDAIRNDPTMKVNQPAVDGLLVRIDPKLYRPPAVPAAPKPPDAK